MISEPSRSAKGSVTLTVTGATVPCFKNRKRIAKNKRSGKSFLRTREDIKERMQHLENAILSELYSESQIVGSETHSECWKRLRTALSELCDDSIREIPCGSWDVEFVPKGSEGVTLVITEL